MPTLNHPPALKDAQFMALLESARSGAAGAVGALTERFYGRVQVAVHHRLSLDLRVGRPWLAARFSTGDIVHEVFESVIKDLRSFGGRTEDAFCGYLAMVVRNRIIDSVRFHEAACRDGRRGFSLRDGVDLPTQDSAADPATGAARAEAIQMLHKSLADLDERERLLVRARFEGVATFAELADQLGYGSESTARRAFFESQAVLAIRLKDLRDGGAGSRR